MARCNYIFKNKPTNLHSIARKAFAHAKEYSFDSMSQMVKNLLLSNFLSIEGLIMFSAAFWTNDISEGGAGFYISSSNYTISIAGCYPIAVSSEIDAEA